MASIKITRSGSFQLSVRNKLLRKAYWATFDTFEEAERFGRQLDEMLALGIVPSALLAEKCQPSVSWSIGRCIAEYVRSTSVPISEIKLLDTMRPNSAATTTAQLSYEWTHNWITLMKRRENLSPSTIRHRHGALARCLDWVVRVHPEILANNPLRQLRRGFATYSPADRHILSQSGLTHKADLIRNRRLEPDEEKAIVAVLDNAPVERVLFFLALETAMRMRECYTLDLSQFSAPKRTIFLSRSKNGDSRQVPL